MPQELKMKIRGLYTDPNNFSEVPEGALRVADNVVIDKDSVVESRRGQTYYGTELSSSTINKLFQYKGSLILSYGSKMAYDSDNAGTWTDYSGTYSQPATGFKMRSIQANRNFYFLTSLGVQKLDSLTATPIDAGGVRALGGTATIGATGSGFMSTATQVAYRVLWGYKDGNDNLILGAPSQRMIVANGSGSPQDVTVAFQVPGTVSTSWFYQIYRSPESASVTSEPNDEMQLVYEDFPSAAEITAGAISVLDFTPDSLKQAFLYTSPSQEGIANANEQPPFCKDFTVYKGYTLFANTRTKQRLTLTLVAVGGSSGVVADSTVTIGGQVYTGKAANDFSLRQFAVVTGGTPAENIADTAINLVAAINQNASNTVLYAYYTSGYDDLPGRFLVEERDVGGTAYFALSSRGDAFNPTLPASGTSVSSSNDEAPNRVYISKFQQPESAPILSYIDAGSKNSPIRRIIALRDSAFVIKDDGIFRFIGEDSTSFRVTLADNTATIRAPDAAVAFNNQIMMMSDQGIVAVSDSGLSVLSRPIEGSLFELSSSEYPSFEDVSFGLSYESDRKYIFFTVTEKTDTHPTQAFVFNSFTTSWTRWPMSRSCGFVNPVDNKLYLGHATNSFVYRERKTFTKRDYADEQEPVTISSASGLDITVASAAGIVVGQSIGQGASESKITAIVGNVLTVATLQSWSAAAAFIFMPITNTVKWLPMDAGNAGVLKQYRELTLFFRDAAFREIDVKFDSNFSRNVETIQLSPVQQGAWGAFPWGTVVWGGGLGGEQGIRTYVVLDKQRASWLNLAIVNKQAFTSFSLTGVSLFIETMSERFF